MRYLPSAKHSRRWADAGTMHTDIKRAPTSPHQARRHVYAGCHQSDRHEHVDNHKAMQDYGNDGSGSGRCTALRGDRLNAADGQTERSANHDKHPLRSGMSREGAVFRTKQSRAVQDFNINIRNIRTMREGVSVQEEKKKGQNMNKHEVY